MSEERKRTPDGLSSGQEALKGPRDVASLLDERVVQYGDDDDSAPNVEGAAGNSKQNSLWGNWAQAPWGSVARNALNGLRSAENALGGVANRIDNLVDNAVEAMENVDTTRTREFITGAGQEGTRAITHAAKNALGFLTLEGYEESDEDEKTAGKTARVDADLDPSVNKAIAEKLRMEEAGATSNAADTTAATERLFEHCFTKKGGAKVLTRLQTASSESMMKLSVPSTSAEHRKAMAKLRSEVEQALDLDSDESEEAEAEKPTGAIVPLHDLGAVALERAEKVRASLETEMSALRKQAQHDGDKVQPDAALATLGNLRSVALSEVGGIAAEACAIIEKLSGATSQTWTLRAEEIRKVGMLGVRLTNSVIKTLQEALPTGLPKDDSVADNMLRKEVEASLDSLESMSSCSTAKLYQAVGQISPILRVQARDLEMHR